MAYRDLKKPCDRRSFLRRTWRYGLAAGITAVTAGLVLKQTTGEAPRCINREVCKGCRIFDACTLPQAEAVRQAGTGEAS